MVIDLTHTIREAMPVCPGTEPPKFVPANTYEKDGFKWDKRWGTGAYFGDYPCIDDAVLVQLLPA